MILLTIGTLPIVLVMPKVRIMLIVNRAPIFSNKNNSNNKYWHCNYDRNCTNNGSQEW